MNFYIAANIFNKKKKYLKSIVSTKYDLTLASQHNTVVPPHTKQNTHRRRMSDFAFSIPDSTFHSSFCEAKIVH